MLVLACIGTALNWPINLVDLPSVAEATSQGQDDRYEERQQMVKQQLRTRGITNASVLKALGTVPRHRFVPTRYASSAYNDQPLPIGYDQTISQPYIVAYMTEVASLSREAKVLEIGTGSGYQTAVLAEIVRQVYTIEIVSELAKRSQKLLADLGYDNVEVRTGDGYQGWPSKAPFDAIVVTAAPDHIPATLIDQLAVGARLIVPVGRYSQDMTIVTKTLDGSTQERTLPVRFVPMTGAAQQRNR